MKTILATAYAINPYKGSEDGMGWHFTMQIARFHKVIVVTRENNRQNIEKFISENPNQLYRNITFLYYDLPYWLRFWKKKGRGAMLYYMMWQRGIVSFIRKQKISFDVVHNLNFHNDWTPSVLWKLKKPFVWGPIGHHPFIPKQYLKHYSFSYWVKDRLTYLVKMLFWNYSFSLRQTKKNANHILCMNKGVIKTLKLKSQYSIMPSVASQDFGWNHIGRQSDVFTVISAGRFVPLKGFDLTIRAFADFLKCIKPENKHNCELLLIGSGPEEPMLQLLVDKLNIKSHVRFLAWMERKDLLKKFSETAAFLFPSHEGAGMVVAEALSFGVPVICLDNEGPGQFVNSSCACIVPQGNYNETVSKLASSLVELYFSPLKQTQMSQSARSLFESDFNWDRRGDDLLKLYAEL